MRTACTVNVGASLVDCRMNLNAPHINGDLYLMSVYPDTDKPKPIFISIPCFPQQHFHQNRPAPHRWLSSSGSELRAYRDIVNNGLDQCK